MTIPTSNHRKRQATALNDYCLAARQSSQCADSTNLRHDSAHLCARYGLTSLPGTEAAAALCELQRSGLRSIGRGCGCGCAVRLQSRFVQT